MPIADLTESRITLRDGLLDLPIGDFVNRYGKSHLNRGWDHLFGSGLRVL